MFNEMIRLCKLKNVDYNSLHNLGNAIFGKNYLYNSYGYFIASLHNLVLKTMENIDHAEPIKERKASRNTTNHTYSVITLNYDLVLEKFSDYLNKYFRSDVKIEFGTEIGSNTTYPSLIKLHGNVSTQNIIPPTWNKVLSDESIKNSWAKAHQLLQETNHIRILGYSLPVTDSYIKFLLKSAVINSEHLKSIAVICLDNQQDEVQEKYDNFIQFHNYRFKRANIEDYLKKIQIFSYGSRVTKNIETTLTFDMLEKAHEDFMV